MSKKRPRRGKPKIPRQPSNYDRDLQKLTDLYRSEYPDKPFSLVDLANWMIDTGKWEQVESNAVKELMRHLQRALRKVEITDGDEKGRYYHAFIAGETQLRLWGTIDNITPEDMRSSLQSRVNGSFCGVRKIDQDRRLFNKRRKPAGPIQLTFNFDARLEDETHSSEYVDQPPPEVDPESVD
ncbi:MAG: hypothetical protein ACJ8C4_07295 [Gemmataceae bacterium]